MLRERSRAGGPVVGFLVSGSADSFSIFVEAFKQGMLDNGMIEDRDYVLDLHFADGDYSRFAILASETVQRKPAAIVVTTISAARAAQRATTTIPIVMTGLIDPVGIGLIASLARPGGNTTGLSNMAQDVMSKLVEILRTTFPTIRTIAILFNPANPANRELMSKEIPRQAHSIGVTIHPIEFKGVKELDATFVSLGQYPPEALIVMSDAALYDLRERISKFGAQVPPSDNRVRSRIYRRRRSYELRTTEASDVSSLCPLRKKNIGRSKSG